MLNRRTSRFGEWHFGEGVKLSLSVSSGQSSLSCSREKLRGGHLCPRFKGRPPPRGWPSGWWLTQKLFVNNFLSILTFHFLWILHFYLLFLYFSFSFFLKESHIQPWWDFSLAGLRCSRQGAKLFLVTIFCPKRSDEKSKSLNKFLWKFLGPFFGTFFFSSLLFNIGKIFWSDPAI